MGSVENTNIFVDVLLKASCIERQCWHYLCDEYAVEFYFQTSTGHSFTPNRTIFDWWRVPAASI